MTAAVNQPEWSGLTIVVGDNRHVLPLYEDDRIHETRCGADCPCEPEDGGQTFGERKHEPPVQVWLHQPLRPETKQ
jgi:hypothetical protein